MWPWYTADDKRSAAAIIALITAMIITAELLMLVAGGMVDHPAHRRRTDHTTTGTVAGTHRRCAWRSPADPAAVFDGRFPGLAVLGCHHPARHHRLGGRHLAGPDVLPADRADRDRVRDHGPM